ncbi:hypothetical protein ATE84_3694 [Aquimarina sp. MAR_2010_214]|uniref:hypothetical protein n=1 Tax=Aquimarina sp. MAR_2010_214 TaxID=1250026 RepID=UPI000C704BAC|nr:hypothetical protein [Aquimarina sp. MAR_2010_214]PKV51605.1 hypothetical protein ATE84_3694 [Aquimarina sp. MAR_2010_214]
MKKKSGIKKLNLNKIEISKLNLKTIRGGGIIEEIIGTASGVLDNNTCHCTGTSKDNDNNCLSNPNKRITW